tara:strand:+ start:652 stop:1380 length:729 start_codon:yes stop_codon:yes gene_type:complete
MNYILTAIFSFSMIFSQEKGTQITIYWYEGNDSDYFIEKIDEELTEKQMKRRDLYVSRVYQEMDDKSHGFDIKYYSNGNKRYERMYYKGKRVGLHKEYYKNGPLKSEIVFKNNEKYGPYKLYHENGNIKQEGNYIKNYRDGEVYFYDKDGSKTVKEFNAVASLAFDDSFDNKWVEDFTSIDCDCDYVVYRKNYLTNFQWEEQYRELNWNHDSCLQEEISNSQYTDINGNIWQNKTLIECKRI